ncbi:hypothetical protein CCR90_05210 [Rhodovulum sulfidophilum]|nr:hypothetical protein [Rhodovulum sulfidophilum]
MTDFEIVSVMFGIVACVVGASLSDGCRFRVPCVIDDFSREWLACVVERSLSGQRVAHELDSIAPARDYPCMVVSDNGTELKSDAILEWKEAQSVEWHDIATSKPIKNVRGTLEPMALRRSPWRASMAASGMSV